MLTELQGASRKPPPRQSAGANPIAWTTPSTPPQRPAYVLGDRLHLGDVGDVHLEHFGHRAQALRTAAGQAHRPPERGQQHLRARRLSRGGDREGDALRGQDAGDDDSLAAEQAVCGGRRILVLTGDVPYKARTGMRSYAATISSIAACHAGVPARMSPLTKTASGSPAQSVTTPPASRTSSAPAAMSQRPRPSSKNPSNAPAPDVGEVEARGAGAAKVLEALQRRAHHRQVPRQAVLATKREAGGHDTRTRVRRHREAASLRVEGTLAFGRAPRLAEQRRDHRTDHRSALLHEGHADADHGKPAHEVGGPVHRIDHPHAVVTSASGFLGEDRDVGRAVAQHSDRRLLCGTIDLGDVVAGALDLCGQRAGPRVGLGDQRTRRRGGGDGELTQSFALVHPSRVRAASGTACALAMLEVPEHCLRRAPGRGHPC